MISDQIYENPSCLNASTPPRPLTSRRKRKATRNECGRTAVVAPTAVTVEITDVPVLYNYDLMQYHGDTKILTYILRRSAVSHADVCASEITSAQLPQEIDILYSTRPCFLALVPILVFLVLISTKNLGNGHHRAAPQAKDMTTQDRRIGSLPSNANTPTLMSMHNTECVDLHL